MGWNQGSHVGSDEGLVFLVKIFICMLAHKTKVSKLSTQIYVKQGKIFIYRGYIMFKFFCQLRHYWPKQVYSIQYTIVVSSIEFRIHLRCIWYSVESGFKVLARWHIRLIWLFTDWQACRNQRIIKTDQMNIAEFGRDPTLI